MDYVNHMIDKNEIYQAIYKRKPEQYLRKQYHLITTDHEEKYYDRILNFAIDRYIYHRHHQNNRNLPVVEKRQIAEAASIIDTIESIDCLIE